MLCEDKGIEFFVMTDGFRTVFSAMSVAGDGVCQIIETMNGFNGSVRCQYLIIYLYIQMRSSLYV